MCKKCGQRTRLSLRGIKPTHPVGAIHESPVNFAQTKSGTSQSAPYTSPTVGANCVRPRDAEGSVPYNFRIEFTLPDFQIRSGAQCVPAEVRTNENGANKPAPYPCPTVGAGFHARPPKSAEISRNNTEAVPYKCIKFYAVPCEILRLRLRMTN